MFVSKTSRTFLPDRAESEAHNAIAAIALALLAPCQDPDFGKSEKRRFTFRAKGPTIVGYYERLNPRVVRPILFDVETKAGVVRCGTSAFAAAALVYGLGAKG